MKIIFIKSWKYPYKFYPNKEIQYYQHWKNNFCVPFQSLLPFYCLKGTMSLNYILVLPCWTMRKWDDKLCNILCLVYFIWHYVFWYLSILLTTDLTWSSSYSMISDKMDKSQFIFYFWSQWSLIVKCFELL